MHVNNQDQCENKKTMYYMVCYFFFNQSHCFSATYMVHTQTA